MGRGRGARLPHSGGLPPHRHRELLAQGHLSGSGLAGRLVHGDALLRRLPDRNGEDNWDDILDQFTSAHKLLWDEQLGLYRHANDCSRKMEWADPVTGQSPVVWLRAEGWFLMALADTYEIAKDRTPRAGELCPLLKNALDRLLPYQVADTGMFLQVVDRADLTGNYSETSGSAMVAYALMKGARLGMLPPEYGERVAGCWTASGTPT